MRKVISLFILLVCLLVLPATSLAIAADTQNTQASQAAQDTQSNQASEKTALTLDDALKLAEQNNIDIKLIDEKIKVTERQLKDANDKSNYLKNVNLKADDRDKKIQNEEDLKLTPKRYEFDLNNLKHDRSEQLKSLTIDIERQFTSASLLQDNAASYQTALDNIDKQINELKLKIKVGMATDISLKPLEAQRVQVLSQLNSTKRQLNEALLNLKKDLGIDLDKAITLAPLKMEYKKYDDSNVNDKIAKALENCYDYKKQLQDIDLTKLEYDIVKDNTDFEGDPLSDIHSLETSISNKEVQLQDLKPSLEVKLRIAYNSLKNLEDTVQVQQLNLESAQLNLNTISAKVKVGMDTNISQLNAQLDVEKQKNALQKAINDYMLGIKDFENQLDQD